MSESIIIAILSSSSIATIITAIINAIITHSKAYNSLLEANRILMKDRIKHLGNSYIQRGSITSEELQDLHEMHECYHDLGGNGFLDAIMNNVNHLPLKN